MLRLLRGRAGGKAGSWCAVFSGGQSGPWWRCADGLLPTHRSGGSVGSSALQVTPGEVGFLREGPGGYKSWAEQESQPYNV